MAINDPRDIPGLLAWYSADYESPSFTDGEHIDHNTGSGKWTDLSGNGNHATCGFGSPLLWKTKGPSGGPAIQFQDIAGSQFQLPNIFSGAVAGEIVAEVQHTAGGNGAIWKMGTAGSAYPNFSAGVSEGFGLSATVTFTPTVSIDSWRRYNVHAASGDWAAYIDGTQQATSAPANTAWSTAPTIGTNGSNRFKGFMSCVIIYDRVLTATERADLVAWLQANPSGGTPTTPSNVTGTLSEAAPAPSVTASGSVASAGSLSLTAPAAVVDMSDATRGTLDTAAPSATVNISGTATGGTLSVTAPAARVSLTGSVPAVASGGLSVTAPAARVSLAGSADDTVHTSTSNAFNGRIRRGFATVETEVAVTPTPATVTRGHDVDKAVVYTTPTLVDGRPT